MISTSQDLEKNMQLAQTLFEGIMTLIEAYHMSVATQDVDKYVWWQLFYLVFIQTLKIKILC